MWALLLFGGGQLLTHRDASCVCIPNSFDSFDCCPIFLLLCFPFALCRIPCPCPSLSFCLGFIPLLVIGLTAFLVEPAEEDVVFLAIRLVSCGVCLLCISSVFALLVFLFLVYLFSIYLFFVSSVSLPGDDVLSEVLSSPYSTVCSPCFFSTKMFPI